MSQSLSLAPSPNVPLVGQLILVTGYTVIAAAVCRCGAEIAAVQLVYQVSSAGAAATAGSCPSCHTLFSIHAIGMAQGQLQFECQVQRPAEA